MPLCWDSMVGGEQGYWIIKYITWLLLLLSLHCRHQKMQTKEWAAIMTGGSLSSRWTATILSQSFLLSFLTRRYAAQWDPSKVWKTPAGFIQSGEVKPLFYLLLMSLRHFKPFPRSVLIWLNYELSGFALPPNWRIPTHRLLWWQFEPVSSHYGWVQELRLKATQFRLHINTSNMLHPQCTQPAKEHTLRILKIPGLADLNRANFSHCFKSWLKSNDFFVKKSCDLNHGYLFTNGVC